MVQLHRGASSPQLPHWSACGWFFREEAFSPPRFSRTPPPMT